MNFLAHIYLSGDKDLIKLGNFIADSVKGNKTDQFKPGIQTGIQLHREIDTFTDAHPIHKASRRRLDPKYGHYKGVIIDIFYDHFLAKNWSSYHDQDLLSYSQDFYKLVDAHKKDLPERIEFMMQYMQPQNWLYNYQYFDGLQSVMNGMNRRTGGKSKMDESLVDLKAHYSDLEEDFTEFFENLITFSTTKLRELTNE